jgi:hypothetical protein
MNFTVVYINQAGRTVRTTVEATDEEDAISVAYKNDAEFSGSDNIWKIVSVD